MKKGDTIRFLDAVGGGKVVQVDEDKELVWIETEDGFDVGPIAAKQCVVVGNATDYLHHKHSSHTATLAPTPPKAESKEETSHTATAKRSQRQRDEVVVDLHIEALPTNGSTMSDREKHQYQLRFFRMQLQQHLRFRGRRLVFIHGKGTGVLKNEIRQILQREYANQVEVCDADYSKYEEGATLVVVR